MQIDDVSKDPAIKHKGKFRACDFPGLIKLSREVRAREQAMVGRLAGKLPTFAAAILFLLATCAAVRCSWTYLTAETRTARVA